MLGSLLDYQFLKTSTPFTFCWPTWVCFIIMVEAILTALSDNGFYNAILVFLQASISQASIAQASSPLHADKYSTGRTVMRRDQSPASKGRTHDQVLCGYVTAGAQYFIYFQSLVYCTLSCFGEYTFCIRCLLLSRMVLLLVSKVWFQICTDSQFNVFLVVSLRVAGFRHIKELADVKLLQVTPANVDLAKVAPTYHLYTDEEVQAVIGRLWQCVVLILIACIRCKL